jgi:uncharacterized membrane protein
MNEIFKFIIILVLFLVIDLPVLAFVNNKIYREQFAIINKGPFILTTKSWIGALVAYFSLAFAIYYFVFNPSLSKLDLFIRGAIMGFIVYSIYNGTNLFTINDYSIKTGIVDTLWGTILLGTISVITSFIIKN